MVPAQQVAGSSAAVLVKRATQELSHTLAFIILIMTKGREAGLGQTLSSALYASSWPKAYELTKQGMHPTGKTIVPFFFSTAGLPRTLKK